MDIWMDLLFGNAIGLAGVITVATTLVIVVGIITMIFIKARKDDGKK